MCAETLERTGETEREASPTIVLGEAEKSPSLLGGIHMQAPNSVLKDVGICQVSGPEGGQGWRKRRNQRHRGAVRVCRTACNSWWQEILPGVSHGQFMLDLSPTVKSFGLHGQCSH